MSTTTAETERVVRKHLSAFLQRKGVDAIVSDYGEGARFYTEDQVFIGTAEITRFFAQFLDAMPPDATDRFELRSLKVEGSLAFITWCVQGDIPLGTDTFVVEGGRIVSQTFAMHAAPGFLPDRPCNRST